MNSLITEEIVLVSYLVEEKKSSYILGLFLEPAEKVESYFQNLKQAALMIKDDVMGRAKELEEKLEEIFHKHFKTPQVVLKEKEIEERVTEKTKLLLKQGKTKEAQALLELVQKKKLPKKLHGASNKAEKAIHAKDYEKAAKLYEEAASYARELNESEIAKKLIERASLARKIPSILEERDKIALEARKNLREENFHKAAVLFKKAADLSSELMDPSAVEEFTLKANALAEFAKVDKKFKR